MMKTNVAASRWFNRWAFLLLILLAVWFGWAPAHAQTLGERVGSATESAKVAVEDAGKRALTKVEQLWAKLDEARLKNRTRDEIVGWAIMGLLVGGLLSRTAGLRTLPAFGLGLLGAFVGGVIVKLAELDFGLGPVLIRYEDLLVSLVGAFVVLFAAKFLIGRRKEKA